MSLDQLTWVWENFGLTGIIGAFVWFWCLPRLDKLFDKHCDLIDALSESSRNHEVHHQKTQRSIMCVGNAVEASAPEPLRPLVSPHIQVLRDTLSFQLDKK